MPTIMEFRMRDQVCYECADLYPVPLTGKCCIFCSRKAAQSRICKIAVRYDRQISDLFSKKKKQQQQQQQKKKTGIQVTPVFFPNNGL